VWLRGTCLAGAAQVLVAHEALSPTVLAVAGGGVSSYASGTAPFGIRVPAVVHRCVDDCADGLAMAGGDGSQALVADVAAERRCRTPACRQVRNYR
jgi:hypothetical protein